LDFACLPVGREWGLRNEKIKKGKPQIIQGKREMWKEKKED